jgi:hypothetical protein
MDHSEKRAMTEQTDNPMDMAVVRRLRRLSAMPVDTSALERRLLAVAPHPGTEPPSIISIRWRWWQTRAIAASLLIAILAAAILLSSSSGPVLASTAQLAQIHNELVSSHDSAMQVDSVDAANRMLASQSPAVPQVPAMPQDHVMACCMKSMGGKKVSCVLMNDRNVPVTLMVANAAEFRLPESPTQKHNGLDYQVQSSGSLNMVMVQRNGRWVCLSGEEPVERLMQLAEGLKF